MKEFLTTVIEMIMQALKDHGLIKTLCVLIGFVLAVAFLLLVWQLPDIILAIKA